MSSRYFVKVAFDGRVRSLLRLVINDEAETLEEAVWTGQEWRPTTLVLAGLAGGDPLMDEITEDQARQVSPAAFDDNPSSRTAQ